MLLIWTLKYRFSLIFQALRDTLHHMITRRRLWYSPPLTSSPSIFHDSRAYPSGYALRMSLFVTLRRCV